MKEHLDEIAKTIEPAIQSRLLGAAGMRTDDGLHLALRHGGSEAIRVVARVADQGCTAGVKEQLVGYGRLVLLAGREAEVERSAERVDERVDLRGEAASRATQCVALDPPFPPEATWCARTTVASTMEPALSTSSWSALNTRAQVPRFAQLLNRLKTDFHGPKRSGRSRHGMPVRARYSTASTNRRSSAFGPLSCFGSTSRSRFHCSSVRAWRCTTTFDHRHDPAASFPTQIRDTP